MDNNKLINTIDEILDNKPGSENIDREKAYKRISKSGFQPEDVGQIKDELQQLMIEANIEERQNMGENITLEDLYPLVRQTVKYHSKALNDNFIDNEDIVQNVMVKIYNKWSIFRGECKLATWVFRIVKNEVINMIIYQNREKRKIGNETNIDEHPFDFEKEDSDVEKKIIENESIEKIYEKIYEMESERDRDILLFVLQGTDYKKVCEIMNVNYPIVRKVVHQARSINIE